MTLGHDLLTLVLIVPFNKETTVGSFHLVRERNEFSSLITAVNQPVLLIVLILRANTDFATEDLKTKPT